MSEAYEAVLRPVLGRLAELTAWRGLHLTSIAKAIEKDSDYRYRVILHQVSKDLLGELYPAVLVNQELLVHEHGVDEPIVIDENLILYADDLPPEHARFAVAHELGHAYLHQPHEHQKEGDYFYVDLPDGTAARQYFAILFKPDQEMQADLFAAILTEQRPAPTGRGDFRPPCLREVLRLRDYFHSPLADVLPLVPEFCEQS